MCCSNSDERFADIALREARKSPVQFRHGCVAVIGGKIVERGYNNYQTYSKDGLIGTSCSCHAEISVLRKCLRRNITGKMNLYIVRLSNSNDDMLSSSPCKECYNIMGNFNIRNIIYSENNNILIKTKYNDFKPYHQTSGKRAIIENRVQQFGNF
uniref:CMP/dCMP-type deaminase domain-containing protein n=1 Tax=viral metagenome TaxID=1070528 RepID=A0A6C0EJN8_9ZZZZ